MIEATAKLVRFANRLTGRTSDKHATADDRARARDVLFSNEARKSLPQASPSSSLAEVLRFYLGSPAFEQWMVSAAMARDLPGLSEMVPPASVEWAARRLPVSKDGQSRLKVPATRRSLLAVLFADPTFMEAVCAEDAWPWSPSVFLPPVLPSADTERFITRLLKRKSPLISQAILARWGLGRSPNVEALYRYGEVAAFRANDLFDAPFYAARYKTGVTNYFDNLRLYVEGGEAEGRHPNAFMNLRIFAQCNPDLFRAVQGGQIENYLEQLIVRDASEHRSTAVHFDTGYYGTQITEADRRRYSAPFAHYVSEGWRDGLEPNPAFDAIWYLRTYPDALRAVEDGEWPNAFSHFVMEGEAAGHRPSAFFDPIAYAQANPDVSQSKATTPFRHFWQQGRLETRDFGRLDIGPVTRHFHRRLPDTRDHVAGGKLVRLPGRPADILREARRPSDGPDLVSILLTDGAGASATGPIAKALRLMGRPHIAIDVGRKQQVHVGDHARFYVSGLAAFGVLELVGVRVVSEPINMDCEFFRYHRLEEAEAAALFGGGADDLKTGFMAWFDFSAVHVAPGTHHLDLAFAFADGLDRSQVVTHETIQIDVFQRPAVSTSEAPIQVAMASYNPPEGPFAAQVGSILANPETHLLISDDASPPGGAQVLAAYAGWERIDLDVNTRNANFVSNFERSLYMRSDSAETLLFADQDDVWRSDKVATLASMMGPGVACAFSDMRIVKGDGEVISETFWQGRRVHYGDALTLGVANTVTGAAAAFPVWLAEIMTPFPRYMGVYHDQWLAVVAAAAGRIEYTSEPLYDYVQHGGNVLGFTGSRSGTEAHWSAIARRLRTAVRRGRADRRDIAYVEVALGSTIPLLQRFVLLQEALLRVPVWSDPQIQTLARGISDAIQGRPFDAKGLLRGWRRLARRAGGVSGLLNIDDMFIAVLTARALIERGTVTPADIRTIRDDAYRGRRLQVARDNDPDASVFERKTQPLDVRVDAGPGGPLRINMFLPELQLGTFFGGYHSKISLISRLVERGVKTRLILVDQPVVDYDNVARIVGAFPELEAGLMRSEIEAHGARSGTLEVGAQDVLLATTWWSSHIVNDVRRRLGRNRFLYFIQEYEPFTFELGTNYRGAEMSYDFPHDAIFSTEILQDYFAHAKVGVYGPRALDDAGSLAFRNPITGLKGIERQPLSRRRPRLLFYARPQAHASRNMYDFGLAALRQAIRELGTELDGWDLVGVGASENALVNLGGDRKLRLISKLDGDGYRQMLASSDVGLALMYTPHPSLVPLEMAAAGLVTVTNACMTKTRDAFAGISDLIDVAEPDVPMIARSLVAAVRRVNAGPISSQPIDWPVSPKGAFPDLWLDAFLRTAERSLNAD